MTTAHDPAAVLADLLAQENARLAAMDLQGAAALLPAKQQAVAALEAARAASVPVRREIVVRLAAEAAANRTLLLRAMAVQKRVIGIVASVRPKTAGRYGRHGAYADRPAAGYALSARA